MKKNQIENGNSDKTPSMEVEIHTNKNALPLTPIDITNGNLPDLDDAEVIPLDLSSEYWTPKLPGETKKVYFDTIKVSQVQDVNNKEVLIDLPCAFFFEKINGEVKTIRNGSKRLVAILENNNIERGTPLQIEYLGKKKNSTNSYMSDEWSCKPLMLKLK